MLKYLIYILLLLILQACSPSYDSRLLKAESLMDCHPDSALSIVRAIDRNKLPNNASRALHALLLTQAETKNYIFGTNDSLISTAVDYYSQTDDSHRRMLANYYLAQVLYNKGDHPKSLVFALKAHDQAKELDQPFWIAMSARMIADIYHENYHTAEQVEFTETELKNFIRSKRQPFINYAMLDLAQTYLNNKRYELVSDLSKQIIDSSQVHNDPYLEAETYRLLGLSHLLQKNYQSAISQYQQLLLSTEKMTSDSVYLGYAYVKLGHQDSALLLLKHIPLDNGGLNTWFKYNLYVSLDSTMQALSTLNHIAMHTDSILKSIMGSNLSSSVKKYYDDERLVDEANLKASRIINVITICLAAIITASLITYIIYYKQKQRTLIERNIEIANNLKNIISINDRKSQETIQNLLSDRFAELDQLCKILYESPSTLAKKRVSEKVNSIIYQFSEDTDKIAALEKFANHHHNDLLIKLKKDFPNIKDADYRFMLYSILGFSNTAIALFLGEEKITAIYNRRKRLKQRFKLSDSNFVSEYLEIIS